MPKAKRLPSGSYRTQVYIGKDENGKKRLESFTAPTARESELMAAQFKADLTRKRGSDMTVGEAIRGYIRAKEAVLSPKTVKEYKGMERNHYGPLKDKSIRKITSEDLQLYISSLVVSHNPKTIANIYGLLSASLSLFCPDRVFNVHLPKKIKKKQIAPSDDEIKVLYDASDRELKIIIALAAFGSCRRGEIAAIKYADVSPQGVTIHADFVENEHKNWIYKEMPKTAESVRFIRLPQSTLELIGSGDPDSFIIPKTPTAIARRFEHLRDRLGLHHIRLHDLRHYFASIAVTLDIPQNYIADFGGWKKDSPVLREVYQNKIIPISEQYAGKLTDHFTGIIGE